MNDKTLSWKGLYYQSVEHCRLLAGQRCIEIAAQITGTHQGTAYLVDYCIKTDENWAVLSFYIKTLLNETEHITQGKKDHHNHWVINGEERAEFNQCTDIDISLTPFTNTLPINRLKLKTGERAFVEVLYINVLEQKMLSVSQQYAKISDSEYNYLNIFTNFQALITVDNEGLVVNYPSLFERMK